MPASLRIFTLPSSSLDKSFVFDISFNYMVEQVNQLNSIFGSLSDPTRRDILKRVSKKNMSVGEIATHYHLTFAAVAKHLDVLHRAKLITKSRRGKEQIVSISPDTLASANRYLENYRRLWEDRLDSLDTYLQSINKNRKGKS
jgi:DNA-binding transcriptional ArsR family regulator